MQPGSIDDSRFTVLIVDDEIDNISLIKRTLRKDYNIITATSAFEALEIMQDLDKEIGLIISDQRMPGMNGTEFLARTIDTHPYTVKILLTGYTDIEAMIDGINKCDLYYYLSKPVDPMELKILAAKAIESFQLTISKNALLKELRELLYTTIQAITDALDEKDAYTHGHSRRVTLYSIILGRAINLDKLTLEKLQLAGLLHDIGKIGTPEAILNKPGGLTHEEFTTMQKHPGKGKDILKDIKQLQQISSWLRSHHEKFDGSGYPEGLKGEEIPLPARILAVADTYDAMTSDRSYRKGLPHSTAVEEIKRCSGSQFDPLIVDIFLKKESFFKEVKECDDIEELLSAYGAVVANETEFYL